MTDIDKSLLSPVTLYDQDGEPLDISLRDRLRVEDLSVSDTLMDILVELKKISMMLNIAFDIGLEED